MNLNVYEMIVILAAILATESVLKAIFGKRPKCDCECCQEEHPGDRD